MKAISNQLTANSYHLPSNSFHHSLCPSGHGCYIHTTSHSEATDVSRHFSMMNEDYLAYLELMPEWCREYRVEAWACCLMPNHVHLILVPETKDGLNLAVGKAHKRYTRRINFREVWRGHLWQGRFASFVMDDNYLLSCTKYIELNPLENMKEPDGPWVRNRLSINLNVVLIELSSPKSPVRNAAILTIKCGVPGILPEFCPRNSAQLSVVSPEFC